MVYQNEDVIKEIEDQLFLIDTKKIGSSIVFKAYWNCLDCLRGIIFFFDNPIITRHSVMGAFCM